MRVGYTIKGLSSATQEAEFARFLKDTLILEEGYADNIASVLANGDSVNIYTQIDLFSTLEESGYDFSVDYEEILVEDGQYLVASAVDFRLEIPFNGGLVVLTPTEYFKTSENLARTLGTEISQGLVKVYPSLHIVEGSEWILNEHAWNDSGIWVDEDEWKD